MTKASPEGTTLGLGPGTQRTVGIVEGSQPGPTVVFVGGIHGNEPSGVAALHSVMAWLETNKALLKGRCYALGGHLWALARGVRYQQHDLNRLWTTENLARIGQSGYAPPNEDLRQMAQLYPLLQGIFAQSQGQPLYFMDLHTTSCQTAPFMTVNDSLPNRYFTQQYPVPMILGIEEYLDGPLLSYVNDLGYVSFGFEAGQHQAPDAVDNHVAFIYLSLVFAGALAKTAVDFERYYQRLLGQCAGIGGIYEIRQRYEVSPGESFAMRPGFRNFTPVRKGQVLATSDGRPLAAPYDAQVFMPLYQAQGNDGYFVIRKVKPVFLRLSALLRRWGADRILPWLPGVRWASAQKEALVLDKRVARFLAKPVLHLLGYRGKTVGERHIVAKNREAGAKTDDYRHTSWWQNRRRGSPPHA